LVKSPLSTQHQGRDIVEGVPEDVDYSNRNLHHLLKLLEELGPLSQAPCAQAGLAVAYHTKISESALPLGRNVITVLSALPAGLYPSTYRLSGRPGQEYFADLVFLKAGFQVAQGVKFIGYQGIGMSIEEGADHAVATPSMAYEEAVSSDLTEKVGVRACSQRGE